MIILAYGPGHLRKHERIWDPLRASSIVLSTYFDGNLKPGAFDVQAIALLLLRMKGVKYEGKLGSTAPMWGLNYLPVEKKIVGTPLEEGETITEACMKVLAQLWDQRNSAQAQALIIDRVSPWVHEVTMALVRKNSLDIGMAKRDLVLSNSIWLASQAVPIILVCDEIWTGIEKQHRIVDVPPAITALADVVLYVEESGIQVESSRGDSLKNVKEAELFRTLGIFATKE